jgi:prepilin-type N-terminal cleavage/methylation domain-containing protein
MRTLQTGIDRTVQYSADSFTKRNIRGFSLLELIIVIMIISVTAALVMPSLWDTGERALKSEAKRLSSTLRYIYDEAAGKKQTYLFKADLSLNSWGYESESESRIFNMEDNIIFKDIVIPSHGKIVSGEITIIFGPIGPEEPVILHLMKDEAEYTIFFNHLNGRAKLNKGYIL